MPKFLIFYKLIAQSLFTLCIRAGNACIPKPAALRIGIVSRPHCEYGVEKMLLALERGPGQGQTSSGSWRDLKDRCVFSALLVP